MDVILSIFSPGNQVTIRMYITRSEISAFGKTVDYH